MKEQHKDLLSLNENEHQPEYKCFYYNNYNKAELINNQYQSYNISSSNTQTVSLLDKGIFPQSEETKEKVHHIKLISSNSLVISTFVKYTYQSNTITIKDILIFAYDILIKESKLITLALPNVNIASKQFNIAKLFSFSINRIFKSAYIVFVILFNLVFIISIKEINNKLIHDILHKEKIKGNRMLYLGHHFQKSEILCYIISKPDYNLITFKCSYGLSDDSINISKFENSNQDYLTFKSMRYTQSSCEWNLFLKMNNTQRSIILNKNTNAIYELQCYDDNSLLSSNSLYLIKNNDNDLLNILRDQITVNGVSIYQYTLEFDKNKEKRVCNVHLRQVYVIQCEHYENHLFNIINDECFYVNFYSYLFLYYLNKSNNTFEYVHCFNIGSICFLAQAINLNTFSLQEKVFIILETFKESNIVFFEFQIDEDKIYFCNEKKCICDMLKKAEMNINKKEIDDKSYINDNQITQKEEEKKTIILKSNKKMKIMRRKDNYDYFISTSCESNTNINRIENCDLIPDILDILADAEDLGDEKDETKEKSHEVTQKINVKDDIIKINVYEKGHESNIDQIISKQKFNQMTKRIQNLNENYEHQMNKVGEIFQKVLSQDKKKDNRNFLKFNKSMHHINNNKQPSKIDNCINEYFKCSYKISNRNGVNNIGSPFENKQQNSFNSNNQTYQYPQYPYPQYNPIFQGNNNTMQNINIMSNAMLVNWQQSFNILLHYQQKMSDLNKLQQTSSIPNGYNNYHNNSINNSGININNAEPYEMIMENQNKERYAIKENKKNNQTINHLSDFSIISRTMSSK